VRGRTFGSPAPGAKCRGVKPVGALTKLFSHVGVTAAVLDAAFSAPARPLHGSCNRVLAGAVDEAPPWWGLLGIARRATRLFGVSFAKRGASGVRWCEPGEISRKPSGESYQAPPSPQHPWKPPSGLVFPSLRRGFGFRTPVLARRQRSKCKRRAHQGIFKFTVLNAHARALLSEIESHTRRAGACTSPPEKPSSSATCLT